LREPHCDIRPAVKRRSNMMLEGDS
jgi:hypothetical protein